MAAINDIDELAEVQTMKPSDVNRHHLFNVVFTLNDLAFYKKKKKKGDNKKDDGFIYVSVRLYTWTQKIDLPHFSSHFSHFS